MGTQLNVDVFHDVEAGVWVATSNEIPGLVTEAETYEGLVQRIRAVTPELLQDNAKHLKVKCVEPVNIKLAYSFPLDAAA